MSWDELRGLQADGVEIASHSAFHKDLSSLSGDAVYRECALARATLRDRLGIEADAIVFPWGRAGSHVHQAVAKCGHTIGLISYGPHSTLTDDPLNLPRVEILGTDDIDSFARKINGELQERASGSASPYAYRSTSLATLGTRTNEAVAVPEAGDAVPSAAPRLLPARLQPINGQALPSQQYPPDAPPAPPGASTQLMTLFARPVATSQSYSIRPDTEIVPGVVFSFDKTARVTLVVEPKANLFLSPEMCLNTIRLEFTGASEWLTLETPLDWAQLSAADRYQLGFHAQSSRELPCQVGLRLPLKSGMPLQTIFSTFELTEATRDISSSGKLPMPDFIELDTSQSPALVFLFDSTSDLSLTVDYLNVYFA